MKESRFNTRSLTLIVCAIAAPVLASCVSSEETGSGGSKAVEPQRTLAPIDTQKIRKEATVVKPTEAKRSNRSGARFLAKSDTVQASVVKKPKTTPRPVIRPENPAYTVQIGAFSLAQNALRTQKAAKERFSDQLVLNNYDAMDKLYRVSLGKFDNRKDASRLRRELIKKFPKDYSQCWVNYITK